jgi:hypothetical protein
MTLDDFRRIALSLPAAAIEEFVIAQQ